MDCKIDGLIKSIYLYLGVFLLNQVVNMSVSYSSGKFCGGIENFLLFKHYVRADKNMNKNQLTYQLIIAFILSLTSYLRLLSCRKILSLVCCSQLRSNILHLTEILSLPFEEYPNRTFPDFYNCQPAK